MPVQCGWRAGIFIEHHLGQVHAVCRLSMCISVSMVSGSSRYLATRTISSAQIKFDSTTGVGLAPLAGVRC